MADRIINANMLKSKPKINFSANNIINGIEVEENIIIKNTEKKLLYSSPTYKAFETNGTYNPMKDNEGLGVSYFTRTDSSNNTYYAQRIYFSFETKLCFAFQETKNNIYFNELSTFITGNTVMPERVTTFTSGATYNWRAIELPYMPTGDNTEINQNNQVYVYYDVFNKTKISGYLLFYVGFKFPNGNGEIFSSHRFNILVNGIYERNNEIIKKYPIDSQKYDFTLETNELMQADTTINGIPIGQHIANDILSQYKNGKATINCTVNISDGMPLFVVGEIAKVYGFDGKSVLRNRDGTDKRFKITSAEIDWVGETTQNIEIVEVIN